MRQTSYANFKKCYLIAEKTGILINSIMDILQNIINAKHLM